MNTDFLVLHTPGAFGNFIGYLIDCHKSGKLLPPPFNVAGSSHSRVDAQTKSYDVVVPGAWDKVAANKDKSLVACVWDSKHFAYILHAMYGRTNQGQFGGCGVEYCQEDFYSFIHEHDMSAQFKQDIVDLERLFGFVVDEQNKKVPRHVLRMFFWYKLVVAETNLAYRENIRLKNKPDCRLVHMDQIFEYSKLKLFFESIFNSSLDFKDTHAEFIKRNKSLNEYNLANKIVQDVIQGKDVKINNVTVMAEAIICFQLEKHFYDIPFFNINKFFESTGEIIQYVKYFPHSLRQPNKLFQMYYKKFQPQEHSHAE